MKMLGTLSDPLREGCGDENGGVELKENYVHVTDALVLGGGAGG